LAAALLVVALDLELELVVGHYLFLLFPFSSLPAVSKVCQI
jgi:hypothetical protein